MTFTVGKEQARAARTALVNTPFDSCFTSPLPRALQTANILWEGRSGPIHHLRELEEANFEWLQVQFSLGGVDSVIFKRCVCSHSGCGHRCGLLNQIVLSMF